MATNAQRITTLEAAVTKMGRQVATLQTQVRALELVVNPPAASIPFDDNFNFDFGGTP